jgi:acyl-CoA synthetase (AMP-forming)/AMP-acid ligase II
MNIVDPILYQCHRQPPAAAICVPGPGIGLISYRRLELLIHNISRRLHALTLPPRSVVAVQIKDVIFHAAIVLALTRLGMITLSAREGSTSFPIKVDALITTKSDPIANVDHVIRADLSWTEGDGRPLEPHLLPQIHEDDLCRVILTSGTTDAPKAIALSHRLLASRINRHLTVFGNRLGNCSRIYSDVPLSSSLGFQFLIYALWRGGMALFPGENFPSTLRALEDYRVQCVVGSPGGFENLLRWFDTTPSYQSDIEVLFCGGDVLSRSLSERLRTRICSNLIAAYGSTETSMSAAAHAHEIADISRAVGFVTPGVTVQIIDASGTILPPGEEGIVRVRSTYAVESYFGDAEESSRVFRDGWFHPGDVGTLSANNLLVISGRQNAVLNLGGNKINPENIELVLLQFKGVSEVAAVSVANEYGNDEIWAVIVAHEKLDESALRTHCEARLNRPFAPVKYRFADSLPHNEMGKIDRRRVQELVNPTAPRRS